MIRTRIWAHAAARRGFGGREIGRWSTTTSWIGAAFIIAFGLTAIVLAIFGTGTQGTVLALQTTARWSFLLFWLAYVGGAMARLGGPRFDGLARRGREFGLSFASAQLVHVGLVLWLLHIAPGPGGMVFFWVGILFTYLLTLSSLPRLRDALEPRYWRLFRTIAVEYIAVAFAADFILGPLQKGGLDEYPLTYLPFAIMLVAGAALRVAALARKTPLSNKPY
jgi:hypothetical protein